MVPDPRTTALRTRTTGLRPRSTVQNPRSAVLRQCCSAAVAWRVWSLQESAARFRDMLWLAMAFSVLT